jgi:hypothetical protein
MNVSKKINPTYPTYEEQKTQVQITGSRIVILIYLNIFWETFAPRANKLIKGAYAYLHVVFK